MDPISGSTGLFSDSVTTGLARALDGLSERQRTTAANIANASTPGYRAKRVSFEDDLAAAMSGSGGTASIAATPLTSYDAGTPADASGNTVQLDAEFADMQKEGVAYQAASQAISFKFSLLRTAITGS